MRVEFLKMTKVYTTSPVIIAGRLLIIVRQFSAGEQTTVRSARVLENYSMQSHFTSTLLSVYTFKIFFTVNFSFARREDSHHYSLTHFRRITDTKNKQSSKRHEFWIQPDSSSLSTSPIWRLFYPVGFYLLSTVIKWYSNRTKRQKTVNVCAPGAPVLLPFVTIDLSAGEWQYYCLHIWII